ncbi:DUF6134 family protein [Henriciella sp.]|uniref:DUF6134 family protein n=1 Tax=Henriciella sp. TaxID=1968823 RepID=UPI002628D07B|nr:DUF6134 family protein [Henriciella sp.]
MKHFVSAFLATSLLAPPVFADTESTSRTGTSPVSQSAPEAWMPDDGDVIRFNVYRKGNKEFGTHIVRFDVASDGSFKATSDVDLKAGLGPITLFRYSLDATETWEGGNLVALEGSTNDDGDKESVSATADTGSLKVDGTGYTGSAPISIIPSSHWNIQQVFSSEILSTENGELLETDVTNLGHDTIEVNGEPVNTTHYRLKSDLTVDLWYDEQNRWVQLSFDARGQRIEYRLAELY